MDDKKYTMEDLEELLDNIPCAVWLKDEYGRYKYVNKYFAEEIGHRKEDIINMVDTDLNAVYVCKDSDSYVKRTERNIELEFQNTKNDKKSYFRILKTKVGKGKKLIGGFAKKVSSERNLQMTALENLRVIPGEDSRKKYIQYDRRILSNFKDMMKCDGISLYMLKENSEEMELYIHNGSKYLSVLDKNVCTKLKSNPQGRIILKGNNEQNVNYLYPIRIKDKLYGAVSLYYNDDELNYIDDFSIKQVCLLLGVVIENRNISNNLYEQLKMRNYFQKDFEMLINTEIDVYAMVERIDYNFKWLYVNKTCEKLTGINCDILGEKSPVECVHSDDKDHVKAIIDNNREGYRNLICRFRCSNGDFKIMRFNYRRILGCLYIITGKDISNERRLLKDKENLQHAVEFESLKTEFFANLSHEFKTPLNIILSTVQVILTFLNNNSESCNMKKYEKYIKGIQQNSYRLLKLANNMIDITKIDGGYYELNLDNYNIVEVVENIVQSVAFHMKNNKRTITFDTMEEEIITACDPEKIERIILNLLSNSMKYTSSDGHIDVDMDVTEDCQHVIIKVRNDGPPINKDDAERIFNRFTQSESLLTRKVEGSGIGLALVKSLVELHKGRIYVNTEVEKGTEFYIELPIRKIMNSHVNHVTSKQLNSRVERFTIEFSDIYTLNQ